MPENTDKKSLRRSKRMKNKQKIAYAVGNIGGLAIAQSSILLLYTHYFANLKIPITALGISLILVIYGIWDAVNEPLLGHLSDLTRSKLGRRKPFIIIGCIPLIIFSVLIYTVPPGLSPLWTWVYLLVILIAYESSVTAVVTSWYSLYAETSLNEKERVDTSKFMQIFGIVGLVIGLGGAPMISGAFGEKYLLGYGIMGGVLAIITVLSMLPTILKVKENPNYQIQKEEEKYPFFESVKTSFKNKSFVFFVIVQFLLQLAYAVVVSSLPLFFKGILLLGDLEYSLILLCAFLTVIPALFLWMKVAEKKGSKFALFASMICFGAVFPFVFFMNTVPVAIIILLLAGFGLSGLMMFPTVLLGDVIDEDQVKTKKRREGYYAGVSGVLVKLSSAISWGVIGIVVTIFNIPRDTLGITVLTGLPKLGLQVLVGVIPVIIMIIGLMCLWKYPLSGDRLKQVKIHVEEMNK
ncbi:MAG: MFS transporter [Promethearchaeota archaeon]|nr:MAG: MFS transporter [Candidatus Lokiarchaeota archaeon]